jgi:molybdopterin molybdotransferase
MLQLEEARDLLNAQVHPIDEIETAALMNALGRSIAEDVAAPINQPPFARSPLDGYAVKGADTQTASRETPVKLRVIGKIYAGMAFREKAAHGEAVRLMTGAPMPEGTDTVIRQEDTDGGEKEVLIYKGSSAYQNYCPLGEDYHKGDILFQKGTVLDAISLAVLASIGMDKVPVFRQPRIAVISTGDEVVQPGQPLSYGKIYDTNLYYVCSRLTELGIKPAIMHHCADDPFEIRDYIVNNCTDMDMMITIGGVSVGEKDMLHQVIALLMAEKLFWKIQMKPGAPTLAARYQNIPVICLSGNPFGAAANFELLIRPMLAKLCSNPGLEMKTKQAVIQNDFVQGGCRKFVRGIYFEGTVRIAEGNHASGAISSMIGCNCLIEIAPGQDRIRKGEQVWVHLL